MKKVYIATSFDDEPLAVLLADSKEKADIAFTSMQLPYDHAEEIDPSEVQGMHGVCYLLTSTPYNSRDYSHRTGGVDFRKWKRGL